MAALQDGRVGEGDDDESMERERLKREAKRTDELVSIIGPVVYLNVVSGTMLWTVRQVSSIAATALQSRSSHGSRNHVHQCRCMLVIMHDDNSMGAAR